MDSNKTQKLVSTSGLKQIIQLTQNYNLASRYHCRSVLCRGLSAPSASSDFHDFYLATASCSLCERTAGDKPQAPAALCNGPALTARGPIRESLWSVVSTNAALISQLPRLFF